MSKSFLDIIPFDILRFIYEEFLDGKYINGTFVAKIGTARKIPLLSLPIPKCSNVFESVNRVYYWLLLVVLKNPKNNTKIVLCKKNYKNVHTPDVNIHVKC